MSTIPVAAEPVMRMSASRLKTWMNCPLQAKFKYVDNEPVDFDGAKAVFGKCVHAALEYYNNSGGDVDTAIKIFLNYWHNPEKIGSPNDRIRWPSHIGYTFGSLKNRGIQIVQWMHDNQRWDDREVVATEHPFVVPFGPFELTGFVDLLELRKSGNGHTILKIVDYKTAARRPNKAELSLDPQFTIYDYASRQREFWCGWPLPDGTIDPRFPGLPNGEWLYELHKTTPRRSIWFHLWDPKEIDCGTHDEADYGRLFRVCEQIRRAEQLQVFVPKIGDACLFCDFTEICPTEPVVKTIEDFQAEETAWL